MTTEKEIRQLEADSLKELQKVITTSELENFRINYLGRKNGKITLLFNQIPKLSISQKRILAPALSKLKKSLETRISQTEKSLANKQKTKQTEFFFDPTIPGKKSEIGHAHPTILVINEIKEIFHYLGFNSTDGPEVEFDEYNFQKLRLHKDHPARDMQQTYYLNDDVLLRTQTSSMQVRYMESHKPPIRMLFPGRVYRREQIDATHLPAFYQIEGLLVDQKTTLTDLLGSLDYFVKKMFGPKTKTRVYGHHFPYTEPSIEVEVLHESGRWLEILGAGMVHPEVLKNCGIDPKKYRGWAFGMGPERIAMLKYGIDDIRLFYSNDMKFLEQF